MPRRILDACLTCGRAYPRGRDHTCNPVDVETMQRFADRNDAALARASGSPGWLNLPEDERDPGPGASTVPPGAPLTTGQLAVWLDALARQYGNDLPLYVQAATPDAPAELCLDAHVQRGPGGERVIVLSAQALPRKEG